MRGSVTVPDKVERVERLRALAGRTVSPIDRALILAAAAELQSLRSALGSANGEGQEGVRSDGGA